MPNRIIKESIHTSRKINQLSHFQFRIWVNLLTYVDDYGRGLADPSVVRGNCLPRLERVTNKDVEQGLHALADIGCIRLYTIDGESYLCFPGWDKHQKIRNKQSKFPAPPATDDDLHTSEIICNQMISSDIKCPRNPIQSNPNPNPITTARARDAEPQPFTEPDKTTGIDRAFDAFWAAYPLHKSKVKAYEAFQALNPDKKLLEAMILAIQKQKNWRRMREGYIPMPATWIRERRWEDDEEPEITETKPRRVLAAQDYKQRDYKESEMREILGVDSIFRADDPNSMFNEG